MVRDGYDDNTKPCHNRQVEEPVLRVGGSLKYAGGRNGVCMTNSRRFCAFGTEAVIRFFSAIEI
jgi:hypothetical protein